MNFYFLPKLARLRHGDSVRFGGHIMDCETHDERTDVADYIADLTAELALMAAWAEHTDLARILEMARLESERLAGRAPDMAEPAAEDAGPAPEAISGALTNVVLLSALRAARS